MKKITPPEFIELARNRHGDKYDYSNTTYVGATSKVVISCKIHGEFTIQANKHLSGSGCQACSGKKPHSLNSFIEASKKVHGDTFTYTKSIFVNTKTPVIVTCAKFGHDSSVTLKNHLLSKGCPKCSGKFKRTLEEFIAECSKTHSNLYDYSKVEALDKSILIGCKVHGDFTQDASAHKSGSGCPKCYGLNKTSAEFITQAISVHGNEYAYHKTNYTSSKANVTVTCLKHGDFQQSPNSHLRGRGCPVCSGNAPHTNESFIEAAKKVHGDKYDYSSVVYGKNNTVPVKIICKAHGEFLQRPMDHLEKCGCMKCNNYGMLEGELREYIESLGFKTEKTRLLLEGKEIDVFIPSLNIGFEFNGLFWHSEARAKSPTDSHKNKSDLAASKGIRLIHVYEDDWLYKKEIIKYHIDRILKIPNKRVFARKCSIELIDTREFLNSNHIQGSAYSVSHSLALVYENTIVAAMQFSKTGSSRKAVVEGRYELVRYATSCNVIGGASKLLAAFVKLAEPKEIVSYSDNDMFTGEMYLKLGFSLAANVEPDYKIVEGGKRHHKSGYRRTALANKYPDKFDSSLTAHQNCIDMKLYRVYNSGLKKWILTITKEPT